MEKPTDRYKGKKITIILPLETHAELKARAEAENRPLANLCVTIILDSLNKGDSYKQS